MKLPVFLILSAWLPGAAAAELLDLTSADGSRTIRAQVVAIDAAGVDLVVEGGRRMDDVALSFFDAATLQRLRALYEAGEIGAGAGGAAAQSHPADAAGAGGPPHGANADVDFAAVNAAVGLELFQSGSLWAEEPQAVAERMRLSPESDTPFTASFRAYFREGLELLGARCWSASLYATKGETDRVALIFAN